MFNVCGEMYYVDLNEVSNAVDMNTTISGDTEQVVNLVSFEVIKMMLEILMTEREEFDDNLGVHSNKNLSVSFKLAFNTLLKHKILKHL